VTGRARVTGAPLSRRDEVLTDEALALIVVLHDLAEEERRRLLGLRARRQADLDGGGSLDFLPETEHIRRDASWRVAPPAPGLEDRRVEITGPTDPRMTVNALNSGAAVWLADFEDASTPHWENVIGGQLALRDAVRGRLAFTTEEGRSYEVADFGASPTIVVRPRGWHLVERGVEVDGEPVAGALVDVALYLVGCAELQLAAGRGPYFYLPKLESHLEARLWNRVFVAAEDHLGLDRGAVRATVLIETITAAFEMEEILYELREHAAGLNAGRWDYLFSLIKRFRGRPDMVLGDRDGLTMTVPFMRAYTELLVATCHRRGAHAIGGMAAAVPNRRDPDATARALEKVRADKRREAADGFDGSWVAHPDLVAVCREEFDAVLGERPHQIDRLRDDVAVAAAQLVDVGAALGPRTRAGLRRDVAVAIEYLAAWLGGRGAVAIGGLMEDAATVEISRSLLWQWVRHSAELDDGAVVTAALVLDEIDAQAAALRARLDDGDPAHERVEAAAGLVRDAVAAPVPPEFLTLAASELLPR
jgi:malate synthase